MVVRMLETCPRCGISDPWRKYATKVVRGERRIYCYCRVCGARETVVYRSEAKKVPDSGTK